MAKQKTACRGRVGAINGCAGRDQPNLCVGSALAHRDLRCCGGSKRDYHANCHCGLLLRQCGTKCCGRGAQPGCFGHVFIRSASHVCLYWSLASHLACTSARASAGRPGCNRPVRNTASVQKLQHVYSLARRHWPAANAWLEPAAVHQHSDVTLSRPSEAARSCTRRADTYHLRLVSLLAPHPSWTLADSL